MSCSIGISHYGQGLFANTNGGEPPLSYLWNTNETTSFIVPYTNGTYIVVVTDSPSCMVTDSMDIMINAIINGQPAIMRVYPNPMHD